MSLNCKNKAKTRTCNAERKHLICWVMMAYRLIVGPKPSILFQMLGANSKRVFQPALINFLLKTLRITFYVYCLFVI